MIVRKWNRSIYLVSIALGILLWPAGGTGVSADEITVVVPSASPIHSVTVKQLVDIYTGRQMMIGRTPLLPLHLPSSNPARGDFLQRVIGMRPWEYDEFWTLLEFQGLAPPKTASDVDDLLTRIESGQAGIGYLWTKDMSETGRKYKVRVVLTIP